MWKSLLVMAALLSGTTQAQIYAPPYVWHGGYGYNAYGWGYTPIIDGLWYWTYFGQPYPSWTNYGYGYYQPVPQSAYAAIAYSPSTGRYGATYGYYDRYDAAVDAMGYCDADDCKPAVWVANGCAALAVGSDQETVGWAYASQQYPARNQALQSCRAGGGQDCRVLVWTCSGG